MAVLVVLHLLVLVVRPVGHSIGVTFSGGGGGGGGLFMSKELKFFPRRTAFGIYYRGNLIAAPTAV